MYINCFPANTMEGFTESYSDRFYYYYYTILNKIILVYQRWKVVGSCDECAKYLYGSDFFYQMKDVPICSLRLQYCSKECLQNSRSKYDYLKTIDFTTELNEESRQVIKTSSFMNTISFMRKYPWTLKETPPALLNHIYTLRTMCESCPDECTKENKQFLADVEAYGIA